LLVRRRRESALLVAVVVVILVAAPMLFTESGFAVDFTNHLWLSWVAGKALVQAGHPTYFLSASGVGAFDPWFAFYGGTLYMIVGGISELSGGHPILAYVGVTTLTIAGSYLGMMWLARECGLRGWATHAPALTVVTSAYYITNLYGRGAWTEFMATAVIAPLLASALHLIRAPAWRPWPILVFVVSVVIFTGSHNISLLWGSAVAIIASITIWLALGRRTQLPIRRLAMVGGLGAVSMLVNAWYLFPDIAYAKDIGAHLMAISEAEASFFDTPGILLNPLRKVPEESTTPALYVQAPVWFLVWGLVAGGVLLWRQGSEKALRRAWIGVVILVCVLLAMIMITPLWSVMPFPFNEIQFPYRLGSYVSYAVGGLVLVGALALQRGVVRGEVKDRTVRGLRLGLIGVCAVSISLCVWQQWIPETLFFEASYLNRQEALTSAHAVPRTWYDPSSYNDIEAPVVDVPYGRTLTIPPSKIRGDHFAAWMHVPPGPAPIQTNIAGGGYLVEISGVKRIGRTPYGFAVVQREREGSGPVHVVVRTTSSATIAAGRTISIAACLLILAILARACFQSLKARHRPVA
jgi:hypothetical protein